MENRGLVSILVPVYNHKKFVGDLIESILYQDYPKIELLMCDDCSQDGSFKEIEKYSAKLKQWCYRFVLIRNEKNLGITKTLNKLVQLSEGEYIKVIASDDFLVEGAISKYVEYMAENPIASLVVSDAFYVNEDDHFKNINYEKLPKFYRKKPKFDAEWLQYLFKEYNCCSPTFFFRKDLLKVVGPYNENSYIEDYDFAFRVAESGTFPYYLDSPQVCYRYLKESLSHSADSYKKVKMLEAEFETLIDHKNSINEKYFMKCIREKYYVTMDTAGQENDKVIKNYLMKKGKEDFSISYWFAEKTWIIARGKSVIKKMMHYN
ncbi:MAG: glycosyltransferase [Acetatifactor sp.]|nr:glycosyltransferase [Acetatifactor sp.]